MKPYEINIEQSIEEKIKIEICNIFEYLMDWRDDFFLDNCVKYFETEYYTKILLNLNKKNNF